MRIKTYVLPQLRYLLLGPLLYIALTGCEEVYSRESDDDPDLIEKFDLPGVLGETSGLIFYDSLFWSVNDGGNLPVLYGLNPNDGSIVREISISNGDNIDWESLAQDDENIYIGDFGNNFGNREDLRILIVPKNRIHDTPEQNVNAAFLDFSFSDQDDFEPSRYATSYDCEAMLSRNGQILMFTKDWNTETSTIYSLPADSGQHTAERLGELDIEGLVTGADYDEESNMLYLCGYDQYIPFVLVYESGFHNILGAEPTRYEFLDYAGYQIEAIAVHEGRVYLTNENSAAVQTLWEMIFSQ